MNSDLGKFRVNPYYTLLFKVKLHYFHLIYTDINSIEINTNIILIMHIFFIKNFLCHAWMYISFTFIKFIIFL